MEIKVKTFQELSREELYGILQLRSEIFVVEQNCVYQDMDGKDDSAIHVLGYLGPELVAYTRIFGPGVYFNEASIGRVSVRIPYRGKKLGEEIMKKTIEVVQSRFNGQNIALSAQLYLKEFYDGMGFVAEGDIYDEDGIAHIRMVMHST
jgi:ElaA protein